MRSTLSSVENEKNVFKNDKGFSNESERERNAADNILKRLTLIKKLTFFCAAMNFPITRNISEEKI